VWGVSRAYRLEADPNNAHQTDRHSISNSSEERDGKRMRKEELDSEDGENAPVGINSSEPFPVLNQSGLPSPER